MRTASAFLALATLAVFAVFATDAAAQSDYRQDEVLVKFQTGTSPRRAISIVMGENCKPYKTIPGVLVMRVRCQYGEADAKITAFNGYAEVDFAERAYRLNAALMPSEDGGRLWAFQNNGQMVNGTNGTVDADMDADSAYDAFTGSYDVTIALLDSGVALNHPDLWENLWLNEGELPDTVHDANSDGVITFSDLSAIQNDALFTDINRNGVIDPTDLVSYSLRDSIGVEDNRDNDLNGYVDDAMGMDFVVPDNDPSGFNLTRSSFDPHGTNMAGIIGAVGNNGVGTAGVMWRVRIMPLRVTPGTVAEAAEAIEYAIQNGADIICAPWTVSTTTQTLALAIDNAEAAGVVVVTSAGNDGADLDSGGTKAFPASYPNSNLLVVAASDQDDAPASFTGGATNFGSTTVDIAAPGKNLYTTDATGIAGVVNHDYAYVEGTSAAAAMAAGAVGFTMAANPGMTPVNARRTLVAALDAVGAFSGVVATSGRINIDAVVPAPPPSPYKQPDETFVNELPVAQYTPITVSAGVTFFSMPVDTETPMRASDFVEAVAKAGGQVDVIYRFVGGAFKPYLAGVPVNDFTFAPGEGYVIRASVGATFSVIGASAESSTVAFSDGWNLVGLPKTGEDAQSLSETLSGHGVTVTVIYRWTGEKYEPYVPGVTRSFPIEPGQAYWVAVSGSASVDF